MAKENNDTFNGFEMISGLLSPTLGDNKDATEDFEYVDPEELKKLEEDTEDDDNEDQDDDENIGDKSKGSKFEKQPIDDDSDDKSDEDSDNDDTGKSPTEENDTEELSEFEEDISKYLKSKLVDEIGIDFPEDLEIKSVSDIVNYLDELVEEASKPKYASQDIEKLDEYVKNGGDLKKFYADVYAAELNIADVDLTNESDQKKVLTEHLKSQGLNDGLIKKKIARWEESGVLEEEAEEAYELLKDGLSKKSEKLLEDQKKERQIVEQRQREFIGSVEKTISEMKDVRGINLSKAEKKELMDYMLRSTKTGRTQYQEDYMSNIRNLIESAYFTKNGDSLISKVKNQAASATYKDLQNKLKSKKSKRVVSSSDNLAGNTNFGLGALSKALLG